MRKQLAISIPHIYLNVYVNLCPPMYINQPTSIANLIPLYHWILPAQLNCLNCQPPCPFVAFTIYKCTCVLSLTSPLLHLLLLKVWELSVMRNSFFEPTVSVKSCSDDDKTIRCAGGPESEHWPNTQRCMKQLGLSRDCYCWGNARYYAVANSNFEEFAACCSGNYVKC